MILFTADWHIKLGQKNVPKDWAINRYRMLFSQLAEVEKQVDFHIVGGDLFDRLPSLEELELYFEWVAGVTVPTLVYDGNHEATKKYQTFFEALKDVTLKINPLVAIATEAYDDNRGFSILPYGDLHKKDSIEKLESDIVFTHVRGEIPPHVKPEIDLDRFSRFKYVFAGDLHSHSNTQGNIIYPGSPVTTSFHRNEVETGYLLIDQYSDFSWTWHAFDLPQLIRKTVTSTDEMIPTDFHHTIYEIEGTVEDLAAVKNAELLDKKIVKRSSEATLVLDKEATVEEELSEYLTYILELDESSINKIVGTFNDYANKTKME